MNCWKYYNHALITTVAPHITIDENSINFKELWRENSGALFARWTSEFDCGYKTNRWYAISEK